MYNDMLDFKFFKDLFWDFLLAISNNLLGASDEVSPKNFNSMWFKSDLQLIFYRNNSNAELLNLSFFENFTFQHSFFTFQHTLHFNISFCCISTQFTFQHRDFYISTHFCISTPVLKCKSVEM